MPLRLLYGRTRRNSNSSPNSDHRWKAKPSATPSSTHSSTARRRLKHLARAVPLRRIKFIVAVVVLITIVLLVVPSRQSHGHAADARHLEQLVSRFKLKNLGSLQLRDSWQAVLSPPGQHRDKGNQGSLIDDEDYWDEDDEEAEVDVEDEDLAPERHDPESQGPTMSDENDGEDDNGEDDDHSVLSDKPFRGQYHELFSRTTEDRKFFRIHFGGPEAYNPNIIPHPSQVDLWIVVAQHRDKRDEITCTAGFLDGTLTCTAPPTTVDTAPSVSGKCSGDLGYLNMEPGARDARMFYGPQDPYLLYGSQSQWTCLGQWLQDLRMLIDAFHIERSILVKLFTAATEVRRPPVWKDIEKNFFVFWSMDGKQYVHHELYPKRVFTTIDFDGSVGEDLAPLAAKEDQICMAKLMPLIRSDKEYIRQSTNSLAITLCKRKDPGCIPSPMNTFVVEIFHHKTDYDGHALYEPYAILFNQTAPFAIHGISQRPLWIHGRANLTEDSYSKHYEGTKAKNIPVGHTEKFYITSMSWKTHGQKYHGYADDDLLLSFGIEDTRSAAIDILGGDILEDVATC